MIDIEKIKMYDNMLNDVIESIYKLYPFITARKFLIKPSQQIELTIKFFYKSEIYGITQHIAIFDIDNIKYLEESKNYIAMDFIKKIQDVIVRDEVNKKNIEIIGLIGGINED